jgi:N-acyl-D-amino-acid deacylase
MSAELVVRNGTILDGSGDDPFVADVLVQNDRIVELGSLGAVDAPQIDATGLFVAPGFIDIHSHSDYTLLVDPRAESAVHQGVTLEVIGNCGHGCFPVTNPLLAKNAIYGYDDIVPLAWSSAADYFDHLAEARPAVNVASLVPNGQLRLSVLGMQARAADATELAAMSHQLEQALDEGAWGYSTGLEYAAEASVPEEEIEVLCRTVARRGALYATHTRWRDDGAVEAVEEALRTADRVGARLQVSHLVPRGGLTDSRRCIEVVEAAQSNGQDVSFDQHTRLFGFTYLASVLPAWVFEHGPQGVVEQLGDAALRDRMKTHRSILSAGGDWRRIVLLDNSFYPEYARRDFASIAAERGQDALDTIYDLLRETGDQMQQLEVIIHCYSEEEQIEAFAHPLCMPGSDATTLATTGRLSESMFHGAYTWAAWFYRFMVRDKGLLTATEAIHKLTGLPAERLGLQNRGLLRAGAYADLAIFDPGMFAETGTTFEPNQLATGMRHVVVNGVRTLSDGALTGSRAGAVLHRVSA